ncbi:hypothetical protein LTEGF4_12480 [Limnohabitans sp. TEGF004]|nr:hypothetical protein LTEGF4_12480 [Limnohabitans sp. TEGF004]
MSVLAPLPFRVTEPVPVASTVTDLEALPMNKIPRLLVANVPTPVNEMLPSLVLNKVPTVGALPK